MKLLIADDHSVVRKGLVHIIKDAYPNAYVHEVADGPDLLNVCEQHVWDIIITDISMPGRNGIEILKTLKDIVPKIPVLVLSVHPAEQYAVRSIKAGASGYLNKDSAPEELVQAIQRIADGRKYITSDVAELLASTYSDEDKPLHELLSDREFEVLKLIASGKTVSEIAHQLSLSVNTVSTYRARILEKTGMGTNAELTHYAISNGLV
jgi:two-component system, NarL family, invasion response regulator UvrY